MWGGGRVSGHISLVAGREGFEKKERFWPVVDFGRCILFPLLLPPDPWTLLPLGACFKRHLVLVCGVLWRCGGAFAGFWQFQRFCHFFVISVISPVMGLSRVCHRVCHRVRVRVIVIRVLCESSLCEGPLLRGMMGDACVVSSSCGCVVVHVCE